MNKKSLWIIGIVIIVAVILVISNSNKEEGEDNLEVAVIIPLTGAAGFQGEDFLNGVLLAKEKIDSKIELHVEDSQSNAREGVTAAKQLLETNNIDVMVSFQSPVVIAILPLADEHNIPLIATAISQDEFTKISENAYRLFPPAREDGRRIAKFANDLGYDSIAVLTVQDEYGETMKQHFKQNFNGDILSEESFLISENDFKTILTKIPDNVDAVYFIGYISHYIQFYKQQEELGKNFVVISNLVLTSQAIRDEVGDLMGNSYAIAPFSTKYDSEKLKLFAEEYYDNYGKQPDWAAPFGYDMVLVLDAVQKSDKDPGEALYELEVEGLNGVIHFDNERETNIALEVIKY